MDVCIKNIDEGDWKSFKSESAKHGLKAGEFFNKIVEEHKKKCRKNNTREILFGEKPLKNLVKDVDFKLIRKEFRENFHLRE
tara:strand:- start:23499 stop:23744 length:246 start_codon:yes stop_codon:yes gene_type:complete